jgi:hydrogenase maturation protein HypF
MGASALHALGRGAEIPHRFAWPAAAPLAQMLAGGVNCPPTSSAGRLFDAAAGLLGIRAFTRFEAQAVMELEGLAERHGPMPPYREGYRLEDDGTLNLLPLLARLAETEDAALGAALFHGTFAQALADWTVQVAARAGLSRVVLAGGCFLNRRLSGALRDSLRASDLEVFAARQLPPNDGGLSLGQAWVALGRGPS